MRRRNFLLSPLCLPLFGSSAHAQSHAGTAKLAILSPDASSSADLASGSPLSMFLQAMRKLGYVEGRNIRTEFRFAENRLDRLPGLAAELVAWRPDVIYTYTTGGARAAANATTSIPIVVGPAVEAVLLTLAGNLAHPTGNVTGLTLQGLGQDEKCLQLLKELAPRASRIGVLLNPDNPAWADYPEVLNPAAGRLGLVLVRVASRGLADIDQTLAALDGEKLDALYLLGESTFSPDGLVGGRIIEFARARHLPSASTAIRYAQHGGLLALGTDQEYLRRRSAEFVHRIIEGTRPGDLPVERPSKVHLSVNLITAKAIGVTVPQALLARADEVIE
jgi:putative tryptophan/tyrosine transport system substrate-binding protein